jgi:hypothetical protein
MVYAVAEGCEKTGRQEIIWSRKTAPAAESGLGYRNKVPFGEGLWALSTTARRGKRPDRETKRPDAAKHPAAARFA